MSSRVGSFNVPPGFSPARSPITSLALAGPPTYSCCPICLSLVSKCKCVHLSPPTISGSLMGQGRAWQPSHFKAEVRTKKKKPDDSLRKIPVLRTLVPWHPSSQHIWGALRMLSTGHGGSLQRNALRIVSSQNIPWECLVCEGMDEFSFLRTRHRHFYKDLFKMILLRSLTWHRHQAQRKWPYWKGQQTAAQM